MKLTAAIHHECGGYWAEVVELPGCFAAGDSFDELFESLHEGIRLYLADEACCESLPNTAS
jgi:predicted RNase H-like HicB family nuclease